MFLVFKLIEQILSIAIARRRLRRSVVCFPCPAADAPPFRRRYALRSRSQKESAWSGRAADMARAAARRRAGKKKWLFQDPDGRARKRNRRNSLIRLYPRRSSSGNARHGPEQKKKSGSGARTDARTGECPGGNVRQRKLKGNVNPAQEEAAGRHLKPPVRAPEQKNQ